ncbi:MAG: hypothetical protein M3O35_09775 [Acidobacteriota bacterium]|nr:hypothetical protein [Acidobacteriota bacterium]
MKNKYIRFVFAVASLSEGLRIAQASGHGPVFGLATPTNPKGGFSFDTSLMGRYGDGGGTMFRATLGYGITEDFKVSISAPLLFQTEPFTPARVAPFTPMGGDFEGLAIWRFHRQDTGVGSRFETAAIGGVLVPGAQGASGPTRGLHSGPGALAGIVTGVASRSHYAWAGVSYQRYTESQYDRKPDVLYYSAVYAYRPPSWRTDTGWDWRIFGELTGERAGTLQRAGINLPGSGSHQVFIGPTTLGVYKNYAVSAGLQVPVYRDVSPIYPRERVRFSVNFSYFF